MSDIIANSAEAGACAELGKIKVEERTANKDSGKEIAVEAMETMDNEDKKASEKNVREIEW